MKVYRIRCRNHLHRIGYDGERWVLLDHDLHKEQLVEELGMSRAQCIKFLKLIRECHHENYIWGRMRGISIGNKELIKATRDHLARRWERRRERARRRDFVDPLLARAEKSVSERAAAVIEATIQRQLAAWFEKRFGVSLKRVDLNASRYRHRPALHPAPLIGSVSLYVPEVSGRLWGFSLSDYPFIEADRDELLLRWRGMEWTGRLEGDRDWNLRAEFHRVFQPEPVEKPPEKVVQLELPLPFPEPVLQPA